MKEMNLKIKHKLLLLLLLQAVLVSIFIIGSTMHLSKDGKEKVLAGVTDKLEGLGETSITEFNKFTQLANEGIRQASGLVAVDEIIAIAVENQKRLSGVIGDAVESIGSEIAKSLSSQDLIIGESLDDLLSGSSASMDEIIQADKASQELLADVATYNMTFLNASIVDSFERLTLLFESLETALQEMVNQNSDEMDHLLVELINRQQKSDPESEQTLAFIMDALNSLKKNSGDRKNNLFITMYNDFHEQKRVMNEELKLMNRKIQYAIQAELGYALSIQDEKVDQVIYGLLNSQVGVMDKMGKVNRSLKNTVEKLETAIPLKLKAAGDDAENKIKEQTADASHWAEKAQSGIVGKVNTSVKEALATFETGIKDSETVIENTLDKSSKKTVGYSLVIASVCTVVAFIFSFFITHSITDPLTRVVAHTEKMAQGDFTQSLDIERTDEIGQLFVSIKNMGEHLRETVSSVSDATDSVNASALEISSTVQEQASITTEQASSISEISATIEEFSQSSSQIAQNAESVAQIATDTLQETEKGVEAVKAVAMRMDEISRENQRSIDEIVELGKKSTAITKFMAIINTIADQTKLIAFNAALEASSAGESGKRFGVVASEIRRLADSVMDSTGEMEVKINEIQVAFNHLAIASEKGSKKVQDGMDASSRTAEMLENLLYEAQLTVDAAKQISLSTQQQKTASEQVVTALREIETGAKQTTESINQVKAVSIDLADLSGSLKDIVGTFKISREEPDRS